MRRLLVAAALGLGLLSAGPTVPGAIAAPLRDASPQLLASGITPVHGDRWYPDRGYHRPHYAPPPRHHWHRWEPPRHHGWHHPRPYRHGWRY